MGSGQLSTSCFQVCQVPLLLMADVMYPCHVVTQYSCIVATSSGADTGGWIGWISNPHFSVKKNSKCHFI